MNNYFEVKVKESYVDSKGNSKIGSRNYIVSLQTDDFSSVETFMFSYMGSSIVNIQTIKEVSIEDVLNLDDPSDGLYYHKCQVVVLEENDTTGKIKKVKNIFYVYANNVAEVKDFVKKRMDNSTSYEYFINSVNRANIQAILTND